MCHTNFRLCKCVNLTQCSNAVVDLEVKCQGQIIATDEYSLEIAEIAVYGVGRQGFTFSCMN